jgi:hypothetical protein
MPHLLPHKLHREKAPNGPLEQQWWVAFAKAQVIH